MNRTARPHPYPNGCRCGVLCKGGGSAKCVPLDEMPSEAECDFLAWCLEPSEDDGRSGVVEGPEGRLIVRRNLSL